MSEMKVENCPKCGGTHFGSYSCPIPGPGHGPLEPETHEPGSPEPAGIAELEAILNSEDDPADHDQPGRVY
jgi:hypothetical protein